jgi:lactate dehydrogenase-like 2-hydroxyacid dehydrogenase
MEWKVFVTRKLPQKAMDWLSKQCKLEVNVEDRVLRKSELIEGVKGKEGLLCLLTDKVDGEIMDAEPRLRMIANYAVGFENIDVEAAIKRKIPVSNTPGVLTDTTAELAWALLFSVARRVIEGDKFCRARKFKGWGPMLMLGKDLKGKVLGIIGAGRIGSAFALKSKGFGLKVLYTDLRKNELLEKELGAKQVELKELLKTSDFISIHTKLTPKTRHLIGERELKLMKPTAILINASRGPIVKEEALGRALKERWIWGAGLDVYENEPAIKPELLDLDNVVLLPHLGSATEETRTKMAMMAAENLVVGLQGKIPPNCVNPEIFKS